MGKRSDFFRRGPATFAFGISAVALLVLLVSCCCCCCCACCKSRREGAVIVHTGYHGMVRNPGNNAPASVERGDNYQYRHL